MTDEPLWVSLEDVIHLNQRTVATTNEPHGVRDASTLAAGLERAINCYHYGSMTSLAALAGEIIFGIGKAHGFLQGNKRTAWATARVFLRQNGHTLAQADTDKQLLADTIEKLMEDDRQIESVVAQIEMALRAL